MNETTWTGTKRSRAAKWNGDNTRVYSAVELEAMDEAHEWLTRVHVPGIDPEPQWNAELIDRHGTVWRKAVEGARGISHGTAGWTPEGVPELALRWGSPAMQHAGPFIGPRVRTAHEIAAAKQAAANARWSRERAA